MVDPITILVAGALWSLAKAIHETCKAIADWFAKIKQDRMASIFKRLQALMDKYKGQGFLSTTGKE
jgi:flagellar motor component MotA